MENKENLQELEINTQSIDNNGTGSF